jgi:mono/diheme cytochrome c family protein
MITRRLAALPLLVILAAPAADAGSADRGRLLYENFCHHCHISEIHYRDGSSINNWAELIRMVTMWQAEMGLDWTTEDIVDVASWLDWVFYRLADAPGMY